MLTLKEYYETIYQRKENDPDFSELSPRQLKALYESDHFKQKRSERFMVDHMRVTAKKASEAMTEFGKACKKLNTIK